MQLAESREQQWQIGRRYSYTSVLDVHNEDLEGSIVACFDLDAASVGELKGVLD